MKLNKKKNKKDVSYTCHNLFGKTCHFWVQVGLGPSLGWPRSTHGVPIMIPHNETYQPSLPVMKPYRNSDTGSDTQPYNLWYHHINVTIKLRLHQNFLA
jgi:hypothetical protein